jgi:mannose-6-phosphate isomerase-like protein (cupin superfamily)
MSVRSPFMAFLSLFFVVNSPCFATQKVITMDNWFQVPDGTSLAPFFNPKDCMSQLPWDLADAFSVAAGEIAEEASIVVHPVVTQLTYVLSGRLEVILKELDESVPTTHFVETNQAVLIKPGAFFQLRNVGQEPCRVLYIVSPAYLFEMDDVGNVVYDDAIMIRQKWENLELTQWNATELLPLEYYRKARNESYNRLALKKTSGVKEK